MEEYGNDFIVLTDEDGNELEFEHVDTIERGEDTYMAFVKADLPIDEPAELVVLKLDIDEESGEEVLVSLADEELYNELFDAFMERAEDELEEDKPE